MLRSDRLYSLGSSLIAGIILIIVGFIMILGQDQLYFDFIHLFLFVTLILGIIQFIHYFLSRQKRTEKRISFTKSFLYLVFCLFFSCFPKIPMSILPILFASYLILNGIIKFIIYLLLLSEKSPGRLKELFMFFVYIGIGLPLLISPLHNVSTMLWIIGVYTILLGFSFIFDFITALIPRKFKNKLRRRIKITLPVFLEAIIPYQVLNEINYFINKEDYGNNFVYQKKNSDLVPDLEVFVHSSMNGFNRLGHVDICFDGKVYSYGNYDDQSKKWFDMIGDGVIFITDKEHYLPFCISHSNKTIFGFGLKLTDSQKKNIQSYIDQLFLGVYRWYPPIVEASQTEKTNTTTFDDYASCLYQSTKAEFYKFQSGRFKHYFVLGVNCCLLADSIVGKSGTDILKVNGVITPGAYYEYLNREFQKKHSMVISKNIYNAESTGVNKKKHKNIFRGFSN